ncbi:MAG: DUF3572 family protein [Alphaproteobacteria bacterium]|nr:MAG: DUF3572 family protein [Alphaproteobacteria bacterium]
MRAGRDERAEALAVALLGWIASAPDRLAAFLRETGCPPADLRRRAEALEPELVAALLDWVLADEGRAHGASVELGLAPGELIAARTRLGDGWTPDW